MCYNIAREFWGEQMASERVAEKVLKAENGQLRDYELLLIINPKVVDEELAAVVEKINQMVTERGGTTSSVEHWGKRKLAYPIEHLTEGNYVLIKFRLEPSQCKQLEASLRISEEVLRHLLIKLAS